MLRTGSVWLIKMAVKRPKDIGMALNFGVIMNMM
jgi:hypothetical protein